MPVCRLTDACLQKTLTVFGKTLTVCGKAVTIFPRMSLRKLPLEPSPTAVRASTNPVRAFANHHRTSVADVGAHPPTRVKVCDGSKPLHHAQVPRKPLYL